MSEQKVERNARKVREGLVVSDKMDKTVVVEVEDRVKHPLYGKVMRRSSKVKAHDEAEVAGVGDLVLITETRMGSGKGSPEWWIANVKPGRVLFELSFPNEKVAKEALTRAVHKLPMKCRIVRREGGEA